MNDPSSLPAIRHIVVDRDGTLNREAHEGWVDSVDAWEWLPGSLEGMQLLAEHGFLVSVATNQSGIGRGVVAADQVASVHDHMLRDLRDRGVELVGLYVCPHAPDEGCECRKPKPGLVRRAMRDSGIGADATMLIGDDARDLEAGREAGARVALVCTGKGSRFKNAVDRDTLVFENLLEAAETISRTAGHPPPRSHDA